MPGVAYFGINAVDTISDAEKPISQCISERAI
jgi:hypothetical protein